MQVEMQVEVQVTRQDEVQVSDRDVKLLGQFSTHAAAEHWVRSNTLLPY